MSTQIQGTNSSRVDQLPTDSLPSAPRSTPLSENRPLSGARSLYCTMLNSLLFYLPLCAAVWTYDGAAS